MDELAVEGAGAFDAAGELVTGGVVGLGHVEWAVLRLIDQRLKSKEAVEDGGTIGKHSASGGADLIVRKTAQRLLDQIDEASFALQGGQQRDGFAAGYGHGIPRWRGGPVL